MPIRCDLSLATSSFNTCPRPLQRHSPPRLPSRWAHDLPRKSLFRGHHKLPQSLESPPASPSPIEPSNQDHPVVQNLTMPPSSLPIHQFPNPITSSRKGTYLPLCKFLLTTLLLPSPMSMSKQVAPVHPPRRFLGGRNSGRCRNRTTRPPLMSNFVFPLCHFFKY
jgi:hypothetical protein